MAAAMGYSQSAVEYSQLTGLLQGDVWVTVSCQECTDVACQTGLPHLQVVKEKPTVVAALEVIQGAMVLIQPVQDTRRLIIVEVVKHPLAA